MSSKRRNAFTITVFALYLALLVWLVVFKLQTRIADLPQYRQLILVPFSRPGTLDYRNEIKEMILNFLCFIPLGYGLAMLRFPRKAWARALTAFGVSLLFETIQYVFAIGTSDVTDLISNTLGALAGGAAYRLARRILKDRTEIVSDIIWLAVMLLLLAGWIFLSIIN